MLGVEVGYVRVSKREQNPELQRRELSAVVARWSWRASKRLRLFC